MSKYRPCFYRSPFGHVSYALVRNQKQLNKASQTSKHPFLELGGAAQCSYFEINGKHVAIVEVGDSLGRSDVEIYGLIAHEAVHVYQRIVERMGEGKPSKEFEAYSIQRICVDLFDSYKLSTGDKS